MNWIPTVIFALAGIVFTIAGVRFRAAEKLEAEGLENTDSQGSIRKARGAHAARARNEMETSEEEVFLPFFVDDFFGGKLDTREKYVGVVSGKSCVKYGFKDGALFLADELSLADPLSAGDFVVVDATAAGSNVGRRIRRIETVNGNELVFTADDSGRAHRSRPREDIVARITHILA